MELFKLFGTIALDNSAANKGIDETTDNAEKAQGKISSAFKKIGGAVVTYFAASKIKDFGMACIDAAANAQAAESQFAQVFGDLEDQASESLSAIADSAGIVENRMKGSYTKIAAFAKTTGMETKDALNLADRALVAVADSAAFYDRTLEETTASLQSFLKGNYENDAALGLSCTETTRNAAANKLYGKSFQELSESQKQLTLLQMVEDANALSGALGQASRESDTWTNQTGNLKQAWTDFTAMIGAKVLPIAVKVVKAISGAVEWLTENKEVLEKVGTVIAVVTSAILAYNLAMKAMAIVKTITTALNGMTVAQYALNLAMSLNPIGLVVAAIAALIAIIVVCVKHWDKIKEAAGKAWEFLKGVWEKVATWFNESVVQPIANFFTGLWDGVKAAAQGAWNFIKGIWEAVTGWFDKRIVQPISNLFRNLWEGIKTMFKTPINWIIGGINTFIRGINKIKIPDWVPVVGGLGFKINELPKLETGGILKKGQVGLLEGNGAEAVVPLDRNHAWINAVANDMHKAGIGDSDSQAINELKELKETFQTFVQDLPDMMLDAFASMKFDVNNREFARMVKAVN